jgi:hypothetical protein
MKLEIVITELVNANTETIYVPAGYGKACPYWMLSLLQRPGAESICCAQSLHYDMSHPEL